MATYPTSPAIQTVFEEQIEYITFITQFESAKREQRKNKTASGRRIFNVIYNALIQADIDILWNFYEARTGRGETFTFNNPVDSQDYTVEFPDMMSREMFATTIWSATLRLVEVK